MIDSFYEESAISNNSVRGARTYSFFNVLAWIVLTVGAICLFIGIENYPFGISDETQMEFLALWQFLHITMIAAGIVLLVTAIVFFQIRKRFNVSFDYCYVDGELRISKVFNKTKRKHIVTIACEEMLQLGEITSESYARLRSDPTMKEIVCTPNVVPAEDKFFMYIYTHTGEKKAYVLECREALLIQLMKRVKRSALESDYVSQERKKAERR